MLKKTTAYSCHEISDFVFEKSHQVQAKKMRSQPQSKKKNVKRKFAESKPFLNVNSPTCSLKCHKTGETPNPKFENSYMLVMEVA